MDSKAKRMFPVDTAGFSDRTRTYLFTNERLDVILGGLDHKGKEVLAVTGAADYSICTAQEAKVTSTDITQYAERFAHLKLAALRTLDRTEFIAFYAMPATRLSDRELPGTNTLPSDTEAFSPKAYRRVRKELGKHDREFFDEIIGRNHFVANRNIPYAFHFTHGMRAPDALGHIPYLADDKAYEQARCAKPTFTTGDIAKASGTYDIIYVSNVPDCLPARQTAQFLDLMAQRLRPGGAIIGFGSAAREHAAGLRPRFVTGSSAPYTMFRAYILE